MTACSMPNASRESVNCVDELQLNSTKTSNLLVWLPNRANVKVKNVRKAPAKTIKHFRPTSCWMNMFYYLAASLDFAFKFFSMFDVDLVLDLETDFDRTFCFTNKCLIV